MRTAAKPAGKTILPSAETSVCFTSSHTHTDSTHNSLRFLSLRIFQNKDGVAGESGTGQTGSPRQHTEIRDGERERELDGVLPDAKLHPRALHPLTCTLSLSLSLALVIPAFTLHRDLMCASLQPQQDASAAHITASMSTETPRPETTTASGSPAAHNDERATMKNRVIIVS